MLNNQAHQLRKGGGSNSLNTSQNEQVSTPNSMGVTPRLQNQFNLIGNKSKLNPPIPGQQQSQSIDSSSGESGYGQRKTQKPLAGSSIASGASAYEVMSSTHEALQNQNGTSIGGETGLSQQQRYASILSQNRARRMNKF